MPGPTGSVLEWFRVYRRQLSGVVVLLVMSLAVVGGQAGAASASVGAVAASAGHDIAAQGSIMVGTQITAPVYAQPREYTPAEIAELNSRRHDRPIQSKGRTASAANHGPLGPELASPTAIQAATATTLRDTTIPTSGISGGSTNLSSTQEPSTDANGVNIFQTGNWYATRSLDNGSTWSYLDPFTLFGSGFCCDQVTAYDAATGRQFWLLQYTDHLVIANASASGPGAFTGWCSYSITPSWLGLPSTTELDYNDVTITNSNVNISTNFFNTDGTSGAGVLRLPKAAMSTCSAVSGRYVTRTDNSTFKLVPGSTDTLYWGSNWGQTNGSSFRVFAWPENSTSYSWWDRTVPSYTFYTRNSGQNCGSTDSVVTNWCQYADSRVLGAFRTSGVLGFSFNAKQDSSHPFPYTRVVAFNESDKSYLAATDIWGSWGAIQYMSLAANSQGQVGSEFAWGGGTGSTHLYPGAAVDTFTAPSPGSTNNPNYYLWGAGNTCTYSNTGLYRWGDYLTVRTYQADPTKWIGAGYAIKGGNCGAAGAYAEPHNILFSS